MQPSVSTHDPKKATKVTLKAVLLLSGVLSIVFLVSFVFSEEGIAELRRARGRVESLRSEIHHLEQENGRLTREIESINRSTFAVERIARQDLGMAKPGEIVYMLPDRADLLASHPVR
ncbi:MAG TPA: septum formation initiator family protein [Thermoanaerobaculia bacterium]|nr:septum formation initiator family protein [Thermoanaerobaculia bacterium]